MSGFLLEHRGDAASGGDFREVGLLGVHAIPSAAHRPQHRPTRLPVEATAPAGHLLAHRVPLVGLRSPDRGEGNPRYQMPSQVPPEGPHLAEICIRHPSRLAQPARRPQMRSTMTTLDEGGTMKRMIAMLVVALALPASAEAFTVQTVQGQSCELNPITEPTRFGFEAPECVARRAASVAFLDETNEFGNHEQIDNTEARNGRLPFSNVKTSSEVGDRVRVDFAIFLKPQRHKRQRYRVRWQKRAGGQMCERVYGGTALNCQVIVPAG